MSEVNWIEVESVDILTDNTRGQRILLVKAKDQAKYLSLFIGVWESEAIIHTKNKRPLPYDLIRSLISHLGLILNGLFIYGLVNDIFYAKLVLSDNNKKIEIDCRSSDGVAIALRMGAKIFILQELLDRAGISLDTASGVKHKTRENPGRRGATKSKFITDEELGKMSAFADFIEGLDLDDLDEAQN